ncbi:MAG: family 10 glycosylhydrolase [Phycisphaerae bacterium]|nr:family 10 glycosylhydrolase [Phycisphaerae bacterium]
MAQRILLLLLLAIIPAASASGPYAVDFTKVAFEPMGGSRDAQSAEIAGRPAVRLPCNFSGTRIDRASWDVKVNLDLTMSRGVMFDFYCADPGPVAYFMIYFRSGGGWYGVSFDAPASEQWSTVTVEKSAARVEGKPAGWGRIDTIRISAWRGQDSDTAFYVEGLSRVGDDSKIGVIRADAGLAGKTSEMRIVDTYAATVGRFLDRAGLEHLVIDDGDVTPERLRHLSLIILPYNPSISDGVVDAIDGFLRTGGRMMSFYVLPEGLEGAAGMKNEAYIRQAYDGAFAAMGASDGPLTGAPRMTKQASWNIRNVLPVEGRSRVAAWWYDDKGDSTGKAAIVVSGTAVHMTHVLLADDNENKFQLFLAMLGNMCPDLWRDAARGCIDAIGVIGDHKAFAAARNHIDQLAAGNAGAVRAMKRAVTMRDEAVARLEAGEYSDAILVAGDAREALVEAYCFAHKPQAAEHRAFWCHSAFGLDGRTWDEAIKILADNGFTAILPNMLWAGVAFYPSETLPVSERIKERGDQVAQCLAACRKYGVECHVWKVNYNMGWASPKEFIAEMKKQGRTQRSFDGTENDEWLCPSHPDNGQLEIDSMVEIARKYAVDGIHFDYIRYPGREGCFCDGCRQRFEKATGRTIENWPAEVRRDDVLQEQWLAFRREQIDAVVSAVAEQARNVRPGVKISAAVFRNWPTDRDGMGQDWKLWCDKKWLDFVCPMDYTASNSQFERMVVNQQEWSGDVPCYPGIGLSVWPDRTDVVKLIEQISITRKHKTGGFTVFNYGNLEAGKVLPQLGKGITRKP